MTACFNPNLKRLSRSNRRLIHKCISLHCQTLRVYSISEKLQKRNEESIGKYEQIETLDNGYIYYFMNHVFRNKLIDNGLWNLCWIVEPNILKSNIDQHYKLLLSNKDNCSMNGNDYKYLQEQQLKYGTNKQWNLSRFNVYPNPVEIRDKWLQLNKISKYNYNYLYKYSYHGFCSIGVPLFDTSHKFCSMQYETKTINRDHEIYNETFIFSFQQINHIWKLIDTFQE